MHTVSEMVGSGKIPRIGVHTPLQHTTVAELLPLWRDVDAAGFGWISVWDHFRPVAGAGPNLEAIAMHATLAAVTERVRVGCLVYSAGYRPPAVLAAAMATIDQVSGGRAVMGLGAGYLEQEYGAYGFEFEPPAVRVERLDSTLGVVRSLLAGGPVDHADRFTTLCGAIVDPGPVQSPLPIWIGGGGERRTIPLAARSADGWNVPMATLEDFARKSDLLTRHALAAGRDPDTVVRSVNLGWCPDADRIPQRFGPNWERLLPSVLHGDADRVVERILAYGEAGADWVMLSLRAPLDEARDEVAWFADHVLPELS